MFKDITMGQYFPADSFIHQLDPRVKILSAFILIIAVFICDGLVAFLMAVAFNLLLIKSSKLKFSMVLRSVKPVIFLVVFTGLINVFLTEGENYIFEWKFIKISYEGLFSAARMAMRIILLISFTSLLTFTTSPIMLTDGIESLLSPFTKIGLPAHELAMMMTIALRFIPTLLEETDKIIMAQKSRGADFESGNLINRAKALIPILVPLFINSFKRADELATAMECRCYRGGKNRTRLKELKFTSGDLCALIIIIAFTASIITVGVII